MDSTGETPKTKGTHGGYRPGGGRPKGALSLKQRTLNEVKARIALKADDIINASLIDALGSIVILKQVESERDNKPRYEPVTDPEEIKEVINTHRGASGEVNANYYVVTAQQGNYKERQYLLDRAFGRPTQAVEVKDNSQITEIARELLKTLIEQENLSKEKAVQLTAKRYNIPESQLISDAIN